MKLKHGYYWVVGVDIGKAPQIPYVKEIAFRNDRAHTWSTLTGTEYHYDINGDVLYNPHGSIRILQRITEPVDIQRQP